jgi:transposase
MRYVEIKSEAQLEVQSLHRVRGRLVAERTALINQLRALMLERGIAVPQGRCKLARYLPAILADERNGLGPRLRRLIEDMREEWRSIDCRIKGFNDELAERVRNEDTAKRLIRIPGIGVLTATALVAAVGNAQTFTCGRDLAAWLGLVPRQATTGGKPRLLHISKRGNGYLRMLLIHGARTALPGLAKKDTPLGRWVKALLARAHRNIVTVALANKLARIAWAVLARDRQYVTVQAIGK